MDNSFLLENFLGHGDGAYRVRPARVERHVSNGLNQFLLCQTIVTRSRKVGAKLVGPVHRDQRSHRCQATVTLRELRTLPNVAI